MSTDLLTPAAQALIRRRDALKAAEPRLRARDLADRLGISEAGMVALGCGDTATRLDNNWPGMIGELSELGPVMALTRNDHVVHEKTGTYGKLGLHGDVGLILGEAIDLRLFFGVWRFGFAVSENGRRSLQFFDGAGRAVHKVYATDGTDMEAFAALITRHSAPADALEIVPATPPKADADDASIDVAGLQAGWDALQDTHHFHGLLRKFGTGRVQALRLAGAPRARQVRLDALRATLEAAVVASTPIMVFVGSPGVIQIHSGPVRRLLETGPWFNVLDPDFNLHLREDAIATAWVVAKPTVDGIVTSLELFDAAGEQIATLFGARKPGKPENPAWRAIMAALPKREAAA